MDSRDHPLVRVDIVFISSFFNNPRCCRFDYYATKTGSIIVPSCGMDSVTSDLPVFLSNKTLKAFAGNATAIDTSTTAYKLKGGVSGGTLATAISLIDIPPHERDVALMDYGLSPRTYM